MRNLKVVIPVQGGVQRTQESIRDFSVVRHTDGPRIKYGVTAREASPLNAQTPCWVPLFIAAQSQPFFDAVALPLGYWLIFSDSLLVGGIVVALLAV
jgi:hypothetical protein